MKRLDWIDHLPPEEAEREAAQLRYDESDEAAELQWQRSFEACPDRRVHWERDWVEDRDHNGLEPDRRAEPSYSPGAPS